MNRALIFGIAIFFAVVGVALLGADNSAVAGHGCNGCGGGYDCGGCGGGCHGGGLFHRLRNRGCHGCHGGHHHHNDCCGQVDCCQPVQDCCQPVDCCGNGGYAPAYHGNGYGAPPAEGYHGAPQGGPAVEAPAAPQAPAAPAPQAQRSQFRFRQVNFRR